MHMKSIRRTRIHSGKYMFCKNMHNVGISFEILDYDRHVPVEWKKFTGNMVFDMKRDFMRKSC